MKRFNTTGTCFPEDHYMVDISERINIIRGMIEQGDYFCINRGRQYGKTTTLQTIKQSLSLVSFCFNQSKEPQVKTVEVGGRMLYEAIV